MNGKERSLQIPAALDLDRPKRPRTTFTEQQLGVLELEFQNGHFVSEERRQILASRLHLSGTQVGSKSLYNLGKVICALSRIDSRVNQTLLLLNM